MVGHTGDMNAAIKACETVDSCAHSLLSIRLVWKMVILQFLLQIMVIVTPWSILTALQIQHIQPILFHLILIDNDVKEIKGWGLR